MMPVMDHKLVFLEGTVIAVSAIIVLIVMWDHSVLEDRLEMTGFITSQFCVIGFMVINRNKPRSKNSSFRPCADNGLWCCLLLPLAVLGDWLYNNRQASSIHHVETSRNNTPVLVYVLLSTTISLLSTVSENVPQRKQRERSDGTQSHTILLLEIASLLCLGPMFVKLRYHHQLFVAVLCCGQFALSKFLPTIFPRSFTFGEVSVVVQFIGLVLWRAILQITSNGEISEIESFSMIALSGISMATGFILLLLHSLIQYPLLFYGVYGGVGLLYVIPFLWYLLSANPLVWLAQFLMFQPRRVCLLGYWLVCCLIAGILVSGQNNKKAEGQQVSTVIRKYFHFVVVAVYVPGLALDVDFLYLGSVVVLSVFIILETMRILHVPPVGEVLDKSFHVFIDEKDQGTVILTHIYLLVGMSLPLWIMQVRPTTGATLPLYSGVLSLGIGDTAASVGGTLIGRHRWPGTKKTAEGTIVSVVCQSAVILLLIKSGLLDCHFSWNLATAVTLSSLFEAFTSQIDNLVLPLLAYSLLCIV